MTTSTVYQILSMQLSFNLKINWRSGTACVALFCCFCMASVHAQVATVQTTKTAQTVQKSKLSKNVQPRKDTAELLNIALQQPMLAERITKAFLMQTRNILAQRARNQLNDSLDAFAKNLTTLVSAAPTDEIRENYELLDQLFDEYRSIKSKPISAQSALELAEQNEELVWISQKGANLLQARAKSSRNDLIATAGDVRILTQRLAKLYYFRASGIRSMVIANDLKKAEEDYRRDMEKLLAAPQNTEQIRNELLLAETQWLFLKQAIVRLNTNTTSVIELEHVSKTCDNILQAMDIVTNLYTVLKNS